MRQLMNQYWCVGYKFGEPHPPAICWFILYHSAPSKWATFCFGFEFRYTEVGRVCVHVSEPRTSAPTRHGNICISGCVVYARIQFRIACARNIALYISFVCCFFFFSILYAHIWECVCACVCLRAFPITKRAYLYTQVPARRAKD